MKLQKIMDIMKNINKPINLDINPQRIPKKKKIRVLTEFEIKKLQLIEDNRRKILTEISKENDVNKISLIIDKLVKEDNLNRSLSLLKTYDLNTLHNFISNLLSQHNKDTVEYLEIFDRKIKTDANNEKQQESPEKDDDVISIIDEKDDSSDLFSDDEDVEIDDKEQILNLAENLSDKEDTDNEDTDEDEIVQVKTRLKMKKIDPITKEEVIVPKSVNLPIPKRPLFQINHNCYLQELTKPWVRGYKYTIVKQIGKINDDNDKPLKFQSFIYKESSLGNPYSNGWYVVNKNFDRLLCRTDKPPIITNNEIIIFNEQDEPVKLQVVYVLHQNRTIEYNTDIEMKRKEYLKRSRMTQEETISQMVSESIHCDDTQVSKSSRLIGKKILEQNGLSDSLEEFIFHESNKISDYFENISKISVLFTDYNFKHLKKNKQENVLIKLNVEDILENVFKNPSLSQQSKEKLLSYYNNIVQKNVELLSHRLYRNTYGMYKRMKPFRHDIFTTDICLNKPSGDDVVYYEDPETMKIYCFTTDEIRDIVNKDNFINPFTKNKFTDPFVEYLKQIVISLPKQNMGIEIEIENDIIDIDDKQQIDIDDKEIIPGFLDILTKNLAKMDIGNMLNEDEKIDVVDKDDNQMEFFDDDDEDDGKDDDDDGKDEDDDEGEDDEDDDGKDEDEEDDDEEDDDENKYSFGSNNHVFNTVVANPNGRYNIVSTNYKYLYEQPFP